MKLQLLKFSDQLKKSPNGEGVYDPLRKKYVKASPEELVRQLLIQSLIQDYHCPAALMSVERQVVYAGRSLRYDLVVFDRDAKPWLLCELKAPHIKIDEKSSMQVSLYNQEIPAPFLLICNGPLAFLWQQTENGYKKAERLPTYPRGGG